MSDNRYLRWLELGGDFFEEIIAAIYQAHVKPGDQVVDVGANHGRHTFPLAACVGRRGRVIAIEALPHLAANLIDTTRELRQVSVVNKAVSYEEGETAFAWVKKDEGFSGIRERPMDAEMASDVEILRVKTSTLDQMIRMRRWFFRKNLSFIKMDIEGGEFDALRGAKALISTGKPIVVFENGGPAAAQLYSYTEDDFFALFDELAYGVFDIFGRPLTRDSWRRPDTPWYGVAVPKRDEEIQLVEGRLPQMIERIERTHFAASIDLSPHPAQVTASTVGST